MQGDVYDDMGNPISMGQGLTMVGQGMQPGMGQPGMGNMRMGGVGMAQWPGGYTGY
jgi:hypothetical protein